MQTPGALFFTQFLPIFPENTRKSQQGTETKKTQKNFRKVQKKA